MNPWYYTCAGLMWRHYSGTMLFVCVCFKLRFFACIPRPTFILSAVRLARGPCSAIPGVCFGWLISLIQLHVPCISTHPRAVRTLLCECLVLINSSLEYMRAYWPLGWIGGSRVALLRLSRSLIFCSSTDGIRSTSNYGCSHVQTCVIWRHYQPFSSRRIV